jgi:hypothetical protein
MKFLIGDLFYFPLSSFLDPNNQFMILLTNNLLQTFQYKLSYMKFR